MAVALRAVHAEDPRELLLREFSESAGKCEMLAAHVLVAVYVRPDKIVTAGGVEFALPEQTRDEDKYQGKIGMVLRIGPIAFTEDASHRWGNRTPQVGDWVMYRIADTFGIELRSKSQKNHKCRIVEDVNIVAIVEEPDLVW